MTPRSETGRTVRPGLRVYGEDTAPPIVLVHGVRVSAAMWTPHAHRLAPDFRVSTVDLPGHGALRDRTFTLAGGAAELDDAVREATESTGRKPLVVGMSLGGFTTMAHAARFPGHAAALVLCGATAQPRGLKGLAYGAAARLNDFIGPERGAARDERLFRRHTTPECAAAVLAGGLAMRAFGEAVRELRQVDFLALAAQLNRPTLVVNGRSDLVFRADERAFVRALRRGGAPVRLRHVRGSHLFPMQDPDVFVALVSTAHRELTERQ
jgi:pimeloyl-ACP methyl ester carboxylesterase